MLTEVEIFTDVVKPERGGISPPVAREILNLRYSDETSARIRDLLSTNNAGTITSSERADLDKYLRVGQFIDLLQAKARVSLAGTPDGTP